MKGKLIVLEGIDGSGKSTQAKLLKADYRLAFPRYDKFFGKIIKWLLHLKYGQKINPYVLAFLFASDRFCAKPLINCRLKEGKTVVLDRYTGSSQAHQGAKFSTKKQQEIIDWIDWLENKLFHLPQPDKVILLNVPPKISKKLMQTRREKDAAEKDFNYQQKTFQLYCQLAKVKKWQIINCVKEEKLLAPKEIHAQIRSRLN